jgi:RNA polymerase sigma-70 factor (ECF subfamily)
MTPATWPSASQGHAELIRVIAQDRDRAAFADLFAYFGPRVKAWLLRAGASLTAADELAQELSGWPFTITGMRTEQHPRADD